MSDEGVLRRVCVVGEGDVAEATLGAAERAGLATVGGIARAMAADDGVDVVVAVGEAALVSLARQGIELPVLSVGPVGRDDGEPVPRRRGGRGDAGRVEPEADIRLRPVDTVRPVSVPGSRSQFGAQVTTPPER
jgi:hypothetical protein